MTIRPAPAVAPLAAVAHSAPSCVSTGRRGNFYGLRFRPWVSARRLPCAPACKKWRRPGPPTAGSPLVHAPGPESLPAARRPSSRHDGDHAIDAVGNVQVGRRGTRNYRWLSARRARLIGASGIGRGVVAEAQRSSNVGRPTPECAANRSEQ